VKHIFSFSLALLLGTAAAHAAGPRCKEARKGLAGRAKVSCAEARKAALAAVGKPNLFIRSAELEEESGKLVYSFDIERTGHPGIAEVQIDAGSGQVVSVAHETPEAEAAERD
jgi:uncharacterized membrane protein YkoI